MRKSGVRSLLKLAARGHRSTFWSIASPLLAIVLTVIVTGVLFMAFGKPPLHALDVFLIQPISSANGITELLVKAGPLVTIGVGIALAARANVWNIGAEGQFMIGAVCGGGLALALPNLPGFVLFPAMLVAATLGGMAYAGLVAYLRTNFNASEILTSLMLNYIAQFLLIYLVSGPWRDPAGFGFPQTAMFSETATAPILVAGTRLHLGIAVALLVSIIGWFALSHTVFGFQLRVAGAAPRAARFAGFSGKSVIWLSMLVSGGLAGLAGIFEVSGPIGQITSQISPGYGYTAIIVAFLGRLHPLGIVLAGLLLALSYLGGEAAQIDLGLPAAVTGIFQGVLLFFLLACDALILFKFRWISHRVASAPVAKIAAANPAE